MSFSVGMGLGFLMFKKMGMKIGFGFLSGYSLACCDRARIENNLM